MLPNLLLIGAPKAATTTLWVLLRTHPEVFLVNMKEPHFFNDTAFGGTYSRGRAWYESLFDGTEDAAVRGDFSTGYSFFPYARGAPERAAELVPDARIVYLIRHPVERMVSQWAEFVSLGWEHRTLVDALVHEAHYSQASCYALQIEQWLEHFNREQVLILRSEDLKASPEVAIDVLLEHLGLPPGWRPVELGQAWNTGEAKVTVPRPFHRIARAAEALGATRIRRTVTPRGTVGRRFKRPIQPEERLLPEDLAADLARLFVPDLTRLRTMVGPDMDLWDLA